MITAFLRSTILYLLIVICLRLLGKRQIGDLEPEELVLTMMLSDLASVPMQNFGIPLVSGIVPIFTLLALSMLLSQLSLKSLFIRRLVCGSPTVLIEKGIINQNNMRHNRFTINELMEELRAQGVCDIKTVKYAILENSGQLSLLLYPEEQPLTPKHLKKSVQDDVWLPTILISDGSVIQSNMKFCNKTEAWLNKQIRARGMVSPREVFLLTINEKEEVFCLPKEQKQ